MDTGIIHLEPHQNSNKNTMVKLLKLKNKPKAKFVEWHKNKRKYLVKVSPGGASNGTSTHVRSFCIPATSECKMFKQIILKKGGFECCHCLMVSSPLNLHSWNDEVPFVGPCRLSNFGAGSQNQPLTWLYRATNYSDKTSRFYNFIV